MSSRRVSWPLVALLLAAFGLRMFQLTAQSTWWDEGISLHLATSAVADLFANRLDNIHPPLYFLLLKGWLALTGVTLFSARTLSALASWALVPAVFVLTRRWFGRGAIWLATVLAAISAVGVIYAQEVRVYAMLPLVYLALIGLTGRIVARDAKLPSWRPFAALAAVAWLGLHLHYIVAFVLIYVNLWALLALGRARRWLLLTRWLAAMGIAALASLPWVGAVVANLTAVQAEANAGTFATEAVALDFLLPQVWAFHLTGLANALASEPMVWLAGISAVVLVALLILRVGVATTRHRTLALLSHWLLPLSSALVVWSVRSFSHPRYVAIFVVGLLLLVAYVAWPGASAESRGWLRWLSRGLSVLLVAAVMATSLWGLARYFFDSAVAKDDMRGVAHFLENVAAPDDLILIPDTDWSLPFEYDGTTPIQMPRPSADDFWQTMADWTAETPTVYQVDYPRGTRDWQQQVAFALEQAGSLVATTAFDGLVVREYALDSAVAAPTFAPVDAQFGPLALTGVAVEQGATADSAVAVALQWSVRESLPADLQVALRLADVDPRSTLVRGAQDDLLLNGSGRPSGQWSVGETVTTVHLVPLAEATPPLSYPLTLSVYATTDAGVAAVNLVDALGAPQGQTLSLGEVALRAGAPSALGTTTAGEMAFSEGLVLENGALVSAEMYPGQSLSVNLTWRADAALNTIVPTLRLRQGDAILAEEAAAPLFGQYPTDAWQVGERVAEQRLLRVPTDGSGSAEVELVVGETIVPLGTVAILPTPHSFEMLPVETEMDVVFEGLGRLVGFNLTVIEVTSDEIVPLTLVWQAQASDVATDYVVFAHILAEDGRLVGQADSMPANGALPTSGWIEGAVIGDLHEMTFREAYAGSAEIEVGFYDPATGDRVLTSDDRDAVRLPISLIVK